MTGTEPHAWERGLRDTITHVGLDVHKATISVALAEGGRGGEVRQVGVFEDRPEILTKLVARLSAGGRRLSFCCEDGVIPARRYRFRETRRILWRDGASSDQPGGPAMYFIGIDVSTKESALCVLDDNGKIMRETKLPSDPEIIARFIADTGLAIERIGLESGCTAGLAVCRAAAIWLAGDLHRCAARGRGSASWFPQQERSQRCARHCRSDARQQVPAGLGQVAGGAATRPLADGVRDLAIAAGRPREHDPRSAPPGGCRADRQTHGLWAAVREVISEDRLLHAAVHPLLETRSAVLCQRAALDRQILFIVRADPVCRLLMTAPVSAPLYCSLSRWLSTIPGGSRARATSGRISA